jgi:predicted phosphate transport protein (TIGR00153 family)
MFKMFFKKEQQVQEALDEYLEVLRSAQDNFEKAMQVYFDRGLCEDFNFAIEQTHKWESKADDIRYAVESLMYEKALIPESRGDMLGLLEAIDDLPGLFDRCLYMLETQRIALPASLQSDFQEMISRSTSAGLALLDQVKSLLAGSNDVRDKIKLIDENESHVDHIERRILRAIFDSDMEPFNKLLVKEYVIQLGEISDLVEKVSRRVYILSVKRRV